ncbi:reducing type I polyketide synthase [Camillea tinctor]|nr:reducing type I polyketide synthase [Camillea tinctor]
MSPDIHMLSNPSPVGWNMEAHGNKDALALGDSQYGSSPAPIAVVGMACRLPGHCKTPQDLWEFIKDGKVADIKPPLSRFDLKGHYDGSQKPGTMKTPGAMFMEDVDPTHFDAQFFNINHTDASSMDPQQRVLLEVSYECLENSGTPKEKLEGTRVGCIVGASAVDYRDMDSRDPEDTTASPTLGVNRALLSNRISHFLGIHGPSITIDTACSSSLTAIQLACLYLRSNEVDAMLVGGVNMYFSPERNQDMGAMRPTASLTGYCHSFDAKADGYVIAEAVNAVFLKRVDDAVQNGDPIRAIIRGVAVNSAGKTTGIAMPNPKAQAAVIEGAYRNAGIPISDLFRTGYVECHGTGTIVGDPIEAEGVASVFHQGKSSQTPIAIGSVKSNVGHSEGAAGLSSLIKVVMSIENGIIPGSATFDTPNPNINFEALGLKPFRHSIPWPTHSMLRASINSFGFGGANAHAVIESPKYLIDSCIPRHKSCYINNGDFQDDFFLEEDLDPLPDSGSSPNLLLLSANDEVSLEAYAASLSSHLLNPAVHVSMTDLTYTLGERRSVLHYRAFAVIRDTKFTKNSFTFLKRFEEVPALSFVFTGQGSQWPMMGKVLLENFPVARELVKRLDAALRDLPEPPGFLLYDELIKDRDPSTLRRPDISQPLITALQLAYVSVLSTWGIMPSSVVGHSSGEIAAAVTAGYLSAEDAIKLAFLRGQAVLRTSDGPGLTMLAVGLSADTVEPYIDTKDSVVQIACLNSPNSVTISGPLRALENLQSRLQADNHFARLLQVDTAYHSVYMRPAGDMYGEMMQAHWGSSLGQSIYHDRKVAMFSTVSGTQMTVAPNAEYWKQNMVSQVKFDEAVRRMVEFENKPVIIVEVGPSNTLSGPIAQISRSISTERAEMVYTSVARRNQDTNTSLYSIPGLIFGFGGAVNLSIINDYNTTGEAAPAILVDLPNYKWNHSRSYWHESLASKDWRHRAFVKHDLLGSKVLGTSWTCPVWKNKIIVKDLPWLKHHRIGDQIVFPASGYICMAIEAIHQATLMTAWKEAAPEKYTFRLRDAKFSRALVLDTSRSSMVMLSLAPIGGFSDSWYEYRVSSMSSDIWHHHASGLIRIESGIVDVEAPANLISPLRNPLPSSSWYESMRRVGLNFGPSFQKHTATEYVVGSPSSRSIVSLTPPDSTWKQSSYILHPACMDGCFQVSSSMAWKGDPCNISSAMVPSSIDSLIIPHSYQQPLEAFASAQSEYIGLGRQELARNHSSSCSVYHPENGSLLFEMTGLRLAELDSAPDSPVPHVYTRVSWDADIHLLSEMGFKNIEKAAARCSDDFTDKLGAVSQRFVNLAAHKKPGLTVAEVNIDPANTSCLLLDQYNLASSYTEPLSPFVRLKYFSSSASTVAAMEERHGGKGQAEFILLDFSESDSAAKFEFDIVVIKIPSHHTLTAIRALENIGLHLSKGGLVLVFSESTTAGDPSQLFNQAGLELVVRSELAAIGRGRHRVRDSSSNEIALMKLVECDTHSLELELRKSNWNIRYLRDQLDIRPQDKVLVIDELEVSVMASINQHGWDMLQSLVKAKCDILWTTRGAQMQVHCPNQSLVHGLFRTIRNENPDLNLITLDVEKSSGDATFHAVDTCLGLLFRDSRSQSKESEFVERSGILHISRILPDVELNKAIEEDASSDLRTLDLRGTSRHIRLQTEKIGFIESVQYHEVPQESTVLENNHVEIEVIAAGVNFKDVAIIWGLIPENEHLLGGEGSGIVTRVAPDVTGVRPGQRVAFFQRGAFGNTITMSANYVHVIPDSMTFVEAATIPCVFMTSLHSLFNIAHIKRGDRVLIHSASGGVGIAAIQLCHYIGAIVYATVGSQEKREFLISSFGIPNERIFSSRTKAFAKQIMSHTKGQGVNVILNSLIGDLLDESWRIIADGGTMVEIGKKDILNHNSLSMEPFKRNATFCALMSKVFELLRQGVLRPISPIHQFSFTEIPAALRYIGSGKHIGKLVISDDRSSEIKVPVRQPPRSMKLKGDVSYLVVGGLRGLCGSLAVSLARNGAKYLTIMSRSSHDDPRSQKAKEDIEGYGCCIKFIQGDVTLVNDVRRVFQQSVPPIRGVIQGAMVLRDRIFDSMTLEDYHQSIRCKVQGTWNIHNVSIEQPFSLDFFTLLSSVSGICGQKGQANYAAANTFLDAFAAYRQNLNLAACSISLGVIEHIGYIAEHQTLRKHFDENIWYGIGESLLRQIFASSIQQQHPDPISPTSVAHMITGIHVPQPKDSMLLRDPRFYGLGPNNRNNEKNEASNGPQDVRSLLLAINSNADPKTIFSLTVDICDRYLCQSLKMPSPLDRTRPLSVYGVDSLVAVEFRGFVKMELGVELTTLEVLSASSLTSLSLPLERIAQASEILFPHVKSGTS